MKGQQAVESALRAAAGEEKEEEEGEGWFHSEEVFRCRIQDAG